MEASPLWRTPTAGGGSQQASSSPAAATGLWAWIRSQLDLAQYRPQAAPGIVVSQLQGRDGDYYVIKNPATRTYYRLSDRDYFVWQRMDGTQTVKDLVVAYFMAYGSFAFARVAGLVAGLKANQFLVEKPVYVYREARQQLQRRNLGHRINSLWQAFLQKQFAISGLDGFVSAVYRGGGRLFFTRVALLLSIVIAIIGLYLYVRLFGSGNYSLVSAQGSVGLGLVLLIVANLLSIFLHEMAHALTVKHYGREVRRAGFMIYFGLPAFFVDTTDIWLEGKRARLAVTWAGPWSGLVLAGLAAIVMTLQPDLGLNPLLYQFAFLAYLTVFVNLNPLLELDGYYLLMDWLEIPMLRRKSMDFLRNGLWAKLKADPAQQGRWSPVSAVRSLSREERIFTVFGLLSAIWTAYAIYIGISFWQRRLAGSLSSLIAPSGNTSTVSTVILALLGVAISLAFIVAVGTYPLTMARRGIVWTRRRGLFAGLWRITALVLAVVLAFSLLPSLLDQAWLGQVLSLAGLALAGALAWSNAGHLAGSRLGRSFQFLAGFALGLLAAEVLRWMAAMAALSTLGVQGVAAALELLAYAALLAAGLILLSGANLRELSIAERVLVVGGWLASYGLAAVVLLGPEAEGLEASLLPLVRSLAPWLALACLVPTIFAFWRTAFAPSWLVLGLALAMFAAMGFASFLSDPLQRVPLSSLATLLLAAGCYLHTLAYQRLAYRRGQPEAAGLISDTARLQRSFDWTADSVLSQFQQMAGQRQARALTERFNNYALAAGWTLSIRASQVDDALSESLGLVARGQAYAAALSLLLDYASQEVGEELAVQFLQRGYDSLAWEQREIGNQYLFRHVARADALNRAFQTRRQDLATLLRQMPLFSAMGPEEIDLLVSRVQPEHYRPGQDIVRQGEPGDRFYILSSGQVEVIIRDEHGAAEIVNRLGPGDYLGELALLQDTVRSATCRVTVPTDAYSLSRKDFDRLVKERFSLRDKLGQSVARANLLRRLPLFAELDGLQVQHVAAQMQEEEYQPGDLIIQQGKVGDSFYVIEAGRVQVFADEDGQERILRESGPGEYFGEIALLLQVLRTASVRAIEPTRLLVMHKDEFDRLVADHLYVSRALELESSRRMIHSLRTRPDAAPA